MTFLVLLAPSARAAECASLAVPGAWEENGSPATRTLDGVAWYRAWVKPAPAFFNKHEHNLFEESVTLNPSDVANAHEAYINDVRIGAGRKFPPAFESGRADRYAHKVPVATLKKDQWNEIAVRVSNRSGSGGNLFFKGGEVGPDLTACQRDNLGTMLISIINPNAEIREGFEYHLVEIKDGRSLSGILVELDARELRDLFAYLRISQPITR